MSISTIGNQFAYNLTPQQRQSLAQALAGNTGQPIQNPDGPISPLSVMAKALQGQQQPGQQTTQQAQLANGAAPSDANQRPGGASIANAMDTQEIMSLIGN